MEFQGPPVRPIWVNLRGVSAQAWNEEVFTLLGNNIRRTIMVDRRTAKEDLEVGRVRIFLDKMGSFLLLVKDLRYFLEITENDEADLEFEASIRGSSRGRESTKSMASETGHEKRMEREEDNEVSDTVK